MTQTKSHEVCLLKPTLLLNMSPWRACLLLSSLVLLIQGTRVPHSKALSKSSFIVTCIHMMATLGSMIRIQYKSQTAAIQYLTNVYCKWIAALCFFPYTWHNQQKIPLTSSTFITFWRLRPVYVSCMTRFPHQWWLVHAISL